MSKHLTILERIEKLEAEMKELRGRQAVTPLEQDILNILLAKAKKL